jgi:hypothetical protein
MEDRLTGWPANPLRPIIKPANHLLYYAWVTQNGSKIRYNHYP